MLCGVCSRPEFRLEYDTCGSRPSSLPARSQDRPVPLAVSRARRCLSAPVREPQDRQVRLSAGVRQRVGCRRVREAQGQVRRVPAPPLPAGHRRGDPLAPLRPRRCTAGISSWASTRCCRTRPASSWPPISTRPIGSDDAAPSWKPAGVWTCRRRWNDRGPATAGTSGCSSPSRSPRRWPAGSVSHILTETMERRPEIGLDSYDRFFPNQDTLPQGGFGNLIALPLQKQPREHWQQRLPRRAAACRTPINGRSCPRSARSSVRRSRRSSAMPSGAGGSSACGWPGRTRTTPSPGPRRPRAAGRSRRWPGRCRRRLELTLGDQIYIAKDGLPPGLRNRLLRLAAFQNPEFYKAQAMRLPTYDKPRIIGCAEDHPQHLGLPRGCLEDVQQLLADLHIAAVIRDERNAGTPLDVAFHGELRPEQEAAARRMLAHDTGVLSATHRLRQDRGGGVAHRPARRQHAGARASPPVAGAMGGAPVGVPRPAAESDRPHRRRPEEAHRRAGCGGHPKPGAQGRGRGTASANTAS